MNFHSDKHFENQNAFEIFFRKIVSGMLLQKVNFYETTFFIKKKNLVRVYHLESDQFQYQMINQSVQLQL